eukprot:PLAT12183.1.p1 GENE.PLAT12183.1~~PLAT12183.1.p1  ORF type:complete len:103 (-),score=40.10 PLAT12183.1:367-675(-)
MADEKPDTKPAAASEPADVKPAVDTVELVVSYLDDEVRFRVKRTTKMKKVFDAFKARKGTGEASFRFLLDGERIHPDQTVAELDLADGDQIDVMMEQVGGCC